ncbi:MAG: membrane protein insertase YidC [Opitutaceae bacterium]|nr:membrane protein insertase YidC [Opitutaceae bacterium]
MDKKNTILGILFIGAAMGLMLFGSRCSPQTPPPPPAAEQAGPESTTPAGAPPATALAPATGTESPLTPTALPAVPTAVGGIVPLSSDANYAAAIPAAPEESLVTLSNDFVDVRFTPMGGAIAEVSLKKYPKHRDGAEPYVLNTRRAAPALALLNFPGADRAARYELVAQTANSIVWRATVAGQVEVTRTYTLQSDAQSGEPYLIHHDTTFRNLAATPLSTPALTFAFGAAEPTSPSDVTALNVSACRGKDVEFAGLGTFAGSGWFGRMLGRNEPEKGAIQLETADISWAAVKNQFFTAILIPEKPSGRVTAQRVALTGDLAGPIGVTGSWTREALTLATDQPASVKVDYYAGPKEYKRLNNFDREQYRLMEWGSFIGIFSALIFKLLNALHGLVAGSDWAWGWAIILTTVIIRTLMWPITAQAARSAKRMGKIQGPLKEIQEKYKDNRVKQQEETIKLFREHKINPVGGCLPLVFQIPIFIGLFNLLRSASELRFADFLWIHDLSAADTVAHIAGFPLNPMPLLMGVTMFIQMKMTPTPTTDNASAKMMKFMPIFVTVMCYGFSSGLAVYWTASNCFSIFQQWVTNKRKDPAETAAAAPAKPGAAERAKPVRDAKVTNVPKKKK